MIRRMHTADAPFAAHQHARLMRHSVFAAFGCGLLECFYRCFAVSRHGIAFVYEEEGTARAAIAAVSDRPAFLRELIARHGLRLAGSALAGLFRRPCRRLLLQMPGYFRGTAGTKTRAEMVFITVAETCRRRGVARELIEATLHEYRRRGTNRVMVSIESDNHVIRHLLQSMGFEVTGTFMFADKSNDLLEYALDPRQAGTPA